MTKNRRSDHPRTHCVRCGECCIRSSPTLQAQDLPLIQGGAIAARDLFTIRQGELVWDNVIEAFTVTGQDILKVREKQEGGCVFFDDNGKACTIYEKMKWISFSAGPLQTPSSCSASRWSANRMERFFSPASKIECRGERGLEDGDNRAGCFSQRSSTPPLQYSRKLSSNLKGLSQSRDRADWG